MWHLGQSLYHRLTSREEYSILLLGLDNAGKTTLLEQIKALNSEHEHPDLATVPTVGQNMAVVVLPDIYLKIWDVGGQHSLRTLWRAYYKDCHAIVFVVDSTDVGDADLARLAGRARPVRRRPSTADPSDEPDILPTDDVEFGRLAECRAMLETVLEDRDSNGVPVLVLANKQDRDDCVGLVNIKERFVRPVFEAGTVVRDSRVLACSALTGEGVSEAVEWLRTRVQWNRPVRPPVMR